MCDVSSNAGCQEGTQNELRSVTTMKPSTPLEQEGRLLTGAMIKLILPMCCFFSQTVNSSVCFKKDGYNSPSHKMEKLQDITLIQLPSAIDLNTTFKSNRSTST